MEQHTSGSPRGSNGSALQYDRWSRLWPWAIQIECWSTNWLLACDFMPVDFVGDDVI